MTVHDADAGSRGEKHNRMKWIELSQYSKWKCHMYERQSEQIAQHRYRRLEKEKHKRSVEKATREKAKSTQQCHFADKEKRTS
jgi:hypothetical protein